MSLADAQQFFENDPNKQPPEVVLAFIASALSSDDVQIRRTGATTAYYIAFVRQPVQMRKRGESTPFDFSKQPAIYDGLLALLREPVLREDRDVRAGNRITQEQGRDSVLCALALAYDPIDSLKPELIRTYETTDSAAEKGRLLEVMAMWDYRSPLDIERYKAAADSDESQYVRWKATQALKMINAKR